MPFWAARAESELKVHVLDVGQADAIFVECRGEYLMIDGGNAADSQLVYSFLRNTMNVDHIDYMVSTHPHEDHVGGLPAALNACSVGKVYSPVKDYDSEVFQSFAKYVQQQGLELTKPSHGETFTLGDATVQFLTTNSDYSDVNNLSLVLKITHGKDSFLFMGDAESDLEHDLIDYGYDLSASVLKVGHHGSDSSTSYMFLREVMPKYAIISVGADNSYGHPTDVVLSRLHDAGAQIFRTDLQGEIVCVSVGDGNITFKTERSTDEKSLVHGADVPSYQESVDSESASDATFVGGGDSAPYIGNANSKKFHYADCDSVNSMAEKNKVEFYSREEAIEQGYVPCKRCNP